MQKVAFICPPSQESFIIPIANRMKDVNEVKEVYQANSTMIIDAIQWADIVWLEWASQFSIELTNHPLALENKVVIMRLHSFEALNGMISKINWNKIHHLIFVSDNVRNISIEQICAVNKMNNFFTYIIPNGVDMNKFPFVEKEKGKNIAYIGYISHKKGPMLMLQAFESLICEDPSYRLHIAGMHTDMRFKVYMDHIINEMGIQDFVTFYGHVDNMNEWLKDKHYVACSSPWESQNMSVMEAMATGICPLVHNFPGSKEIYPEKYIWTTVNEFRDLVLTLPWEQQEYRNIIQQRYEFEAQFQKILFIFNEIGENFYGSMIDIV